MVNTEEVIKKAKQAIKICSDIDTARAYVSDIANYRLRLWWLHPVLGTHLRCGMI